jgi:hypothetical protein
MSDRFSPEALSKHVFASLDDAFKGVPEGKKFALLIDATTDTAQMIVAFKPNTHWQVAFQSDWDGNKIENKISSALVW